MIFVTVGTHEQPFDRLIQCIDRLSEEKLIHDECVIQTGFSRYIPKFCRYRHFFSHSDMTQLMENAEIIITHGGPSSFMPALEKGKIPIVVPRRKKFGEHINDHQFDFVKRFSEIQKTIIFAENDEDIKNSILHYSDITQNMPKKFISHNAEFTENIERLAMELLK